MRSAPSSIRSDETAPVSIAAAMALLFMCEAPGISWSRPATIDMLCVAPQSDMTQPLNPSRLRTSHGYV